MKVLILFALLAVACAQYRGIFPGFRYPIYPAPVDEVYAASLGGAPVGIYDRKTDGYPNRFPRYGYGGRGEDISSASLGGAKVGVYGKEQGKQPYYG